MKNKNIRVNKRLTDDLVLQDFLSHELGYANFSLLMEDLRNSEEGFNSNGISHFCERISSNGVDISSYDLKISEYVRKISQGRERGFMLRYYQYLAVLFTEIYLDLFFSDRTKIKKGLIDKINEYIEKSEREGSNKFSSTDFKMPKLAYYMATGSGKTIIMHINYLQFIYHAKRNGVNIDNCILITPSEQMTRQHLSELRKSHIEAIEFNGLTLDTFSNEDFAIKVIDINKLKKTDAKKGSGVTIDISGFGSNNLILVDEGHKGYKSEERTWSQIRDALSSNGFAFEYSATFEQAVSNDPQLYAIYSHSIIIDYSYRHFYGDGYGKDFHIINIGDIPSDEENMRNTLLLANSLSFLSQMSIYQSEKNDIRTYNVERPLWIFVGSKVSVSDKKTTSDIVDVVKFLDWVTSPANKEIVKERVELIKNGRSGIQNNDGNDVFTTTYNEVLFPFGIRDKDSEEIYSNLLFKIFKSRGTRGLGLYKINETAGEIGLVCDSDYFGVIDIGDRNQFLKGVEENLPQIEIHDEKLSESLFNSISNYPEKINILIGAKKFIEGWDTKRVSSMCLLNIGKSEGAQIIQLFGRGVRLNGLNGSGKREEDPSTALRNVQTLFIFGVKASYLTTFRDIIKQESLFTLKSIIIENNSKKISPPLEIINFNEMKLKEFKKEIFNLTYDQTIFPQVNFLSVAETISSNEPALRSTAKYDKCFLDESKLEIIDWNKIYFKILDYKFDSNLNNMIISKNNFDSLIQGLFYSNEKSYELFIEPELCEKFDLGKVGLIEDAVFELLKRYIIKFNERIFKERITSGDGVYQKERFKGPIPDSYKLYVDSDFARRNGIPNNINSDYIRKNLKTLPIELVDTAHKSPTRMAETSVYTPLISYSADSSFYTIPAGLNTGERKFVTDLITFLNSQNVLTNKVGASELYLYRNPVRSGYHFYILNESIFPDFILWIRRNEDNRKDAIVYLEPHGLVHSDRNNDPKLNLPRYLQKMCNSVAGLNTYAFIISVTDLNKLNWSFKNKNKNDLLNEGIVFQEDKDYIEKIFQTISF